MVKDMKRNKLTILIILFLIIFNAGGIYAGVNEDLREAANQGNITEVTKLLTNGADIHSKGKGGKTALVSAACKLYGKGDMIELLLSKGAKVNAMDESGVSALFCAATFGNEDQVRILLKNGANVNTVNKQDGTTPLIQSSAGGHTEIVRMLLEKKPNLNVRDKIKKLTAIEWAKKKWNDDAVELLKAAGAK